MQVRSIMASRRTMQTNYRIGSSRLFVRASHTRSVLHTRAFGWSLRCWPKSNTGRSLRKGSCGIRFSKDCVMTCNGTPVWVYQGKELKVFASEEAAQKWLDENDPEGVAFKCEVEGEE